MYSESYITVLKEINFLAWAYSQENKTRHQHWKGKSKTIPNVGVVILYTENPRKFTLKLLEIVN